MPSAGPLPVREGDVLAGKYRVERVIGSGGMGIVVAARHQQLGQLVAIKFVRDEAIGDEGAVERFLREARAAVKLKSEHAAKVLDVGTLESGAPYMVMEFLEGSDLGQVLEKDGPLPVVAATEWVLQACEAVAEAHAAGIVHRDLKPQNLFLARTVGGLLGVKVLDFGVSKSMGSISGEAGSLTRTKTMLGSPLYMSPEQMRSARDVNATADVWALGVVLFELLTGRWPFEAETMPDLCLKVVSEPPLSLAKLRPEVPALLVEVVERCLSKDPANRYANGAELASALEAHVPPASRVWAERARLAMSSVHDRGPGSTELPSAPTLQSARYPASNPAARTAPTPAAWGSEGGSVASSPRRARFAIAGVVVAGVAAVAAVLALHGTQSKPATITTPPVAASVVTDQGPPRASASPPASATVELAAPFASQVAPVPSATSVPSAHAASAAAATAKGVAQRPRAIGTKPTNHDDDIPALR
jgi:eukaryotic-like serine/threonine-protein kinase